MKKLKNLKYIGPVLLFCLFSIPQFAQDNTVNANDSQNSNVSINQDSDTQTGPADRSDSSKIETIFYGFGVVTGTVVGGLLVLWARKKIGSKNN